jgi:hypothetical protein
VTTLDRLRGWNQSGVITDIQYHTLAALVRRERFPVFLELNASLYTGVLAFAAGLAWTFQTYSATLGDSFILATFTLLFAGCLYYCFVRGPQYSNGPVKSPSLPFDYVLYLGCLILSAELAYVEYRFSLFQGAWNNYLLFTTAVFALLAYRFDNRFVLSLALASFAGWFGLRISALDFLPADSLRISALIYGAMVAVAGTVLFRAGIKPHFLESYLHIAANVIFTAVASGIGERRGSPLYVGALTVLSTVAIALGLRWGRFVFVAYGIIYGYIGISVEMLPRLRGSEAVLGYFLVTGTLAIVSLVILARRFGRDE